MRSFVRLLMAGTIAAPAALSLTQVAQAGQAGQATPAKPAGHGVPAPIRVPPGNKLFLAGHGVGVQIYSCTGTPGGFSWSFVAPRANLYNRHGRLIITHYAGPTWQARDGSKVVGRAVASVTVDPTAIPWLLLSAASTAAGADGNRLAGTTYVQRVNATGGIAPPGAECTAAAAGTQADVPYTADYYFWKKARD
jgi:hypothetical protein